MSKMRFGRTRVLLSSGILLAGVWIGAMALFTDTATSAGSFTSGTVDITVAPTTALFNVGNMAPGDVVYAPLTVSNAGSLELRYDMSTTTTNVDGKGLGGQLTAEVRKVTAACTSVTFLASLNTVASSAALSSLASTDYVMAPGASEVHCYKVTLPLLSGNAFQNASTTATFTFNAEQTANN
jgi:spore coat-associated protein N